MELTPISLSPESIGCLLPRLLYLHNIYIYIYETHIADFFGIDNPGL